MRIYYDRGIIVEDENGDKLYLDPELSSTPIKYPSLVTHAHSDHTAAVSGGSLTYLTKTTLDLYNVTSKRNSKNYSFVEFNEPFEVGQFEIEYIGAGHLLGAAQIVIRKGNKSFLYTGDFCPEDLLTVKGADMPNEEIDLTVIDSTYGDPLINFDSRASSRQNLFIWIIQQLGNDKIPIINVGHLGGAQEIIKFLNKLAENMPVIISERVKTVAQVYEKHGVGLDYYSLNDKNVADLMEDKCVILMPRSFKKITELVRKFPILDGRFSRAIVTGQTAKYGFSSFNFASALSTHAHFDELITTTKDLNPKHVLTHYGYHEELASSLLHDYQISAESFELSRPVDVRKLSQHQMKHRKTMDHIFEHTPLDNFF